MSASVIPGGRILVAEDNPLNQRLVLLHLKRLGYEADAVSSGEDAVRAVIDGQYILVLMDCHMPRMDGFSATVAIRRSEAGTQRHIPILAMTASTMEDERHACLEAGMDDFVAKPFEIALLAETLVRWLGGGHSLPQD